MSDGPTTIFTHTDSQRETVRIDEYELKSKRKMIMLRILDEDEVLEASVELSVPALVDLWFKIGEHVQDVVARGGKVS